MDPAQALELEEIARNSVINETIARGDSPVHQFYAGAVVLVTGGSGFVGKHLIEKLFRCNVQKVYILLRSKKGKDSEDRLKDVIQDQLFDYLHKTQPDFVTKLIPIEADVSKIQFGMSEENWTTLMEEVNIIFHGAATLNFTEPLKSATLINIRGTREMLSFAKSCKNLKSLVHISTAFVHVTSYNLGHMMLEKFYECPLSPNFLIDLVHELDEDTLNAITPQLIGKWPNTYTFTKALAEELVRTTAADLPICIVRPSLVLWAYRESPGWVDTFAMNGPIGIVTGTIIGGLHVIYSKPDTVIDMIPVDFINNAVMAAAHDTVKRRARGETNIRIYTVSSNRNLLQLNTIKKLVLNDGRALTTPKILWHNYVTITESKFLFFFLTWLLHFIPGYMVDFILKLKGQKPKAIKLYTRAYKLNMLTGSFLNNNMNSFEDSNLLELNMSLSPDDRIIFECDAATIDMQRFMHIGVLGIRKYVLKDGLQNTQLGVKKAFWLRFLNIAFLMIYAYVLWKILSVVISLTNAMGRAVMYIISYIRI